MAKITVTREDAERLNCETWEFRAISSNNGETQIKLNTWSRAARPSRRHGWTVSAFFDAGDRRNTNAYPETVPPEIVAEARAQFIARINTEPDTIMSYVTRQRAEREERRAKYGG